MLEKVKSLYKVVLFCITLFFSPLVSACISGIEAVEANITLAITMASTMVEFILYYRAPQSATNDKKFRRRQANTWLMNLKMDLSKSLSVEAIDQLNLPLIFMMKRVRNAFERVGIVGSNPRYVVMMALPNPNAVVTAVLDLSGVHDPDVTLMKLMRTKCTANPYVVTPPLSLTALDGLIATYEGAHGAARKVALVPLIAALNAIMLTYQLFANLPVNKSNSIVIIQSGGFHVKGVGGKTSQIWEAFQSNVAGEILMTFVVFDPAHCYDVWLSTDGIAWVREEPVIHAHARISGLTPNTSVWVRYQLVTALGGQGGYIPIKIQVPA
ncbi:MAG: hypothetical protein WCL14_11410 [Bacteroidota bacterium]